MAVIKNELPVPVAPAAPSTGLQPIQWGALPEVANASPAMQMVDDPDLGTIQVPAGMDPGAFAAATAGARAEAQRKKQMQANMGTLGQIVAPLMEGPTQVYPQAAPVAAMAMGPNYKSFRQGQQQQIAAVAARKAEQERNALVEKQELARRQDEEKDRRQRLQVEMMRMKNDKDESAIRQQFDRSKMEQERMMADASREDSERDRLGREQLTRDQMASREKVAGMRAAARGGGGGGDGVDGKRAAAHQKYVQDRYKEYIDRGGMESDEAWSAAVTDAKRFYPEYYLEDAPRQFPVSATAVGYGRDPNVSNEATRIEVNRGVREGDIAVVDPVAAALMGNENTPAQAQAAPPSAPATAPPVLNASSVDELARLDDVAPRPAQESWRGMMPPGLAPPTDAQRAEYAVRNVPPPAPKPAAEVPKERPRTRMLPSSMAGGRDAAPKSAAPEASGPPTVLDANGIPHVDLGSVLVPVARWAALTPEQQKKAIEDAAKR